MDKKIRELLGATWAVIDLDAIKQNIENIKKYVGKQTKIMGVVKGNGYGHDAVEVSTIILENGADQLAVARIEEAIILRKSGIKAPILVLTPALEEQLKLFFEYNIMVTINELKSLYILNNLARNLNKKIKVHIKIDTGMHRLGISPFELKKYFLELLKLSYVKIVGIFSHFSTADESNKEYSYKQFNLFLDTTDFIRSTKIKDVPCFHIANSGAILDLPKTWLDMVRPGCILYGLYPSMEVEKKIDIFPALSLNSRVYSIKKIKTGSFVGYGRDYLTTTDTIVATIPVGYADGYSRLFSNSGTILIQGQQVPVIGRVCMDQTMIDISSIKDVNVGEQVVLLGTQGEENISAIDIALKLNTIADEVVHIIDKTRVAKLFIKNNKPWKIKNMLGEYLL